MKEFRMAVTGVGVVSRLGLRREDFFSYLRTGAASGEKAAECAPIEPGNLVKSLGISDPKLKIARYMDAVSKNCIAAMSAAMADAGITEEDIAADPCRYAIVAGASRGAGLTRDALYGSLESRRGKMVSGTLFSHCGYNIAGAMAAIAYGIRGPNLTVAGRGDIGPSIVRRVNQFLATGRAHTVFAGFTECGTPGGDAPFLNEMAFFLCLESEDRAVARGARRPLVLAQGPGAGFALGSDAVCGFKGEDDPSAQGCEIMKMPPPGVKAPADRYSSLLMLGLLGRDEELSAKYSSTAFAAGAGENETLFRILYAAPAGDGKRPE